MPPTLCARPKAGRTMVCALRSGVGVPPKGGAPTLRSVRSIFPAAHVAGKNDFILSAASAGNQEGAPAPSWNFPRTEDEGRRPPFYRLLLPVAPTIRLAAKRLRRRDPVPGWLMKLSSTTRRARRPGVPPPVPRRSPTTQCRRQNYQAFPNLVSHKAKRPESPQPPHPGPPSPVPRPNVPRKKRLSSPRENSKGEARRPLLWSFQGGSGREIEIPPRIFLRDCQGGFFQFGKNPP